VDLVGFVDAAQLGEDRPVEQAGLEVVGGRLVESLRVGEGLLAAVGAEQGLGAQAQRGAALRIGLEHVAGHPDRLVVGLEMREGRGQQQAGDDAVLRRGDRLLEREDREAGLPRLHERDAEQVVRLALLRLPRQQLAQRLDRLLEGARVLEGAHLREAILGAAQAAAKEREPRRQGETAESGGSRAHGHRNGSPPREQSAAV